MKALNTMKFVANAVSELTRYEASIRAAETYEEAANRARKALGCTDCCITFLNTMICAENNDFTAEFGDVLDGWLHTIYQAMASKAIETKQSDDLICKLLQKRDEYEAL